MSIGRFPYLTNLYPFVYTDLHYGNMLQKPLILKQRQDDGLLDCCLKRSPLRKRFVLKWTSGATETLKNKFPSHCILLNFLIGNLRAYGGCLDFKRR